MTRFSKFSVVFALALAGALESGVEARPFFRNQSRVPFRARQNNRSPRRSEPRVSQRPPLRFRNERDGSRLELLADIMENSQRLASQIQARSSQRRSYNGPQFVQSPPGLRIPAFNLGPSLDDPQYDVYSQGNRRIEVPRFRNVDDPDYFFKSITFDENAPRR